MIWFALLALIASIWTVPTSGAADRDQRCNILLKQMWNSTHVELAAGNANTPADRYHDTLEVFLADELSPENSRVSDDGQAIYMPTTATKNRALLRELINTAMVRRIATQYSIQCPGLDGLDDG